MKLSAYQPTFTPTLTFTPNIHPLPMDNRVRIVYGSVRVVQKTCRPRQINARIVSMTYENRVSSVAESCQKLVGVVTDILIQSFVIMSNFYDYISTLHAYTFIYSLTIHAMRYILPFHFQYRPYCISCTAHAQKAPQSEIVHPVDCPARSMLRLTDIVFLCRE